VSSWRDADAGASSPTAVRAGRAGGQAADDGRRRHADRAHHCIKRVVEESFPFPFHSIQSALFKKAKKNGPGCLLLSSPRAACEQVYRMLDLLIGFVVLFSLLIYHA
jgi:hypothetical protein